MTFIFRQLQDLELAATSFLQAYPKGGAFGLTGPLGVGKTTWVKSLVRKMAQKTSSQMPRVTSPSFVVHQSYGTEPPIEHFDFYRLELKTPESLIEIGYWEAFDKALQHQGYVFIEWPEKANIESLRLTASLRFSFGLTEDNRVLSIA